MQYNITYRKKDNGWQCIVSYKFDGKWKQKSKQGFKGRYGKQLAQDAADNIVKKLEKEISEIDKLDHDYDGITFYKFSKIFINHQRLYRENNTVHVYLNTINYCDSIMNLEMTKITSIDIQKCVDRMVQAGLKNSTIITYAKRINVIFNSALHNFKIISTNPAQNIILPKSVSSNKKALTISQLNCLLDKLENRDYYLISLLAGKCGLRIGEIMGLTWDNINYEQHQLTINKQWKLLDNSQKRWGFGTLKGKNSERIIPISNCVVNTLKEYRKASVINIDNRIFSQKSNSNISEKLSRKYKELGFDISIHELRHTYATILIGNGVDFKTAANLLGHNVIMTMKTYSHVTTDMYDKANLIINKIL